MSFSEWAAEPIMSTLQGDSQEVCGYAVFFIGAALELVGYPLGLVLSIPGGLFELVFGTWLIVKGLAQDVPWRGWNVPRHAGS